MGVKMRSIERVESGDYFCTSFVEIEWAEHLIELCMLLQYSTCKAHTVDSSIVTIETPDRLGSMETFVCHG